MIGDRTTRGTGPEHKVVAVASLASAVRRPVHKLKPLVTNRLIQPRAGLITDGRHPRPRTPAAAHRSFAGETAVLGRFLSNLIPPCLSFRSPSASRRQSQSPAMLLATLLEGERKSGAIWYELFRQSPKSPGSDERTPLLVV